MVGGRAALADRAVAGNLKGVALQHLDKELLLVIAAAVVVDTVGDGAGCGDAIQQERAGGGGMAAALPSVSGDVAVFGVRLVGECHVHAVADIDDVVGVICGDGGCRRDGTLYEVYGLAEGVGAARSRGDSDRQLARRVGTPEDGDRVVIAADRGGTDHRPRPADHVVKAGAGMGCVGHLLPLARHNGVRQFVVVKVAHAVEEALGLEVASDGDSVLLIGDGGGDPASVRRSNRCLGSGVKSRGAHQEQCRQPVGSG